MYKKHTHTKMSARRGAHSNYSACGGPRHIYYRWHRPRHSYRQRCGPRLQTTMVVYWWLSDAFEETNEMQPQTLRHLRRDGNPASSQGQLLCTSCAVIFDLGELFRKQVVFKSTINLNSFLSTKFGGFGKKKQLITVGSHVQQFEPSNKSSRA